MIRKANTEDAMLLSFLAAQLWPENPQEALLPELRIQLNDPECALFLMFCEDNCAGFAQCQLRHDYVEGTQSSPVGYLEGIYVCPEHRRQGYARQLLAACQQWAKEMGCGEFASDCELANQESLVFHLALGFVEANRIICFTKPL